MRLVMFSFLLVFFIAVPAFSEMGDMHARGQKGHGQMMAMSNMDKMGDMMSNCIEHADKIGLTDEQKLKAMPLHRDMQKKHAQFKADVKIAEIELMEIMEVKDFDLDKATAAVKKIDEIKADHHLETLKTMKEMHAILTDEQFRKMKTIMSMEKGGKKPAKKMMKKR